MTAGRPDRAVRVVGIVAAGGRGERFGREPKQWSEIAGRAVLDWAIERLRRAGVVEMVLVLPADRLREAASRHRGADLRCVVGGASRQESVSRGLAAVGADADLVAVHDAARPAAHPDDVRAVIAAAATRGAAILGRPLADTLKRVEGDRVVGTIHREGLFRAETPQVFRPDLLRQAVAVAARDGFLGTDEASLVERLPGAEVVAVPARHPNPKITWPGDLALAEVLLRKDLA